LAAVKKVKGIIPVKKAPLKEFRKVAMFHLFPDGSIKNPSKYMVIPKTNSIKRNDKSSFKIVQLLLSEKNLKVFRILTERNRIIPDKEQYTAMVAA